MRLPVFARANADVDIEMLESARFALLVNHDDADRELAQVSTVAIARTALSTSATMAGDRQARSPGCVKAAIASASLLAARTYSSAQACRSG